MSANTFPAQIEPFKWAEQGFVWSGHIPLARFSRIAQDVVPPIDDLSVFVDCRLYIGELGFAWLDATMRATLPLTCQRCLHAVEQSIDTTVHLALLHQASQADRLDDDADFVVLSEEQWVHGQETSSHVDLLALLEDELLLSAPLAPRHDHCDYAVPVVEIEDEPAERENPFSVLASLKQRLDS